MSRDLTFSQSMVVKTLKIFVAALLAWMVSVENWGAAAFIFCLYIDMVIN